MPLRNSRNDGHHAIILLKGQRPGKTAVASVEVLEWAPKKKKKHGERPPDRQ